MPCNHTNTVTFTDGEYYEARCIDCDAIVERGVDVPWEDEDHTTEHGEDERRAARGN